jgi:hypothetical protein
MPRRVSFEFSHHSLRTNVSFTHPAAPTNRLSQTSSSKTRAHEKYAIHTYRILCTTHYIRVLLLRRDTVRVHFLVAALYYIYYTYIYIYVGRYIIYTPTNEDIYISMCVIDGWTGEGVAEFRAREFETSARPIRRRHRQNALIIAGYIFYVRLYLYIMYIYIIYVYRWWCVCACVFFFLISFSIGRRMYDNNILIGAWEEEEGERAT